MKIHTAHPPVTKITSSTIAICSQPGRQGIETPGSSERVCPNGCLKSWAPTENDKAMEEAAFSAAAAVGAGNWPVSPAGRSSRTIGALGREWPVWCEYTCQIPRGIRGSISRLWRRTRASGGSSWHLGARLHGRQCCGSRGIGGRIDQNWQPDERMD